MKLFSLSLVFAGLIVGCCLVRAASQGEKSSGGSIRPTGEQAEIDLIKKMENDRVQAGVRKDVEAIAPFTADEYLQIDFNGRVMDKAATFERIRSSNIRLQSNTIDQMTVRIYGDVAVVTGRGTPKGVADGRDYVDPVRYSRIYVKRDGRWQVVLFQLTRIAQ